MKKNNLVGHRFNRLVVVADGGRCKKQNVLWLCRCDCGGETRAFAYDLRAGKVKSCGCYNRDIGKNIKHGHARKGVKRDPLYSVWASMLQRCSNPSGKTWQHYGLRGITVCERWRKSFENFLEDMGERPSPEHSIDRIDVNGNYEPSNCRWATRDEQSLNKRSTVLVTVGDVTKPLKAWVTELGVTKQCIYYWVKKGLSYAAAVERILSKSQGQGAA